MQINFKNQYKKETHQKNSPIHNQLKNDAIFLNQ